MSKVSKSMGKLQRIAHWLGLEVEVNFCLTGQEWAYEVRLCLDGEYCSGSGTASVKIEAEAIAAEELISILAEGEESYLNKAMKAAAASYGPNHFGALRDICLFTTGTLPEYAFRPIGVNGVQAECRTNIEKPEVTKGQGYSERKASLVSAGRMLKRLGLTEAQPMAATKPSPLPSRRDDGREHHEQHQQARWRRYPEEPQNMEAAS